jgi:hypothetical protein
MTDEEAEVEQAWLEEADRRWQEIESGQVTCESAEVALPRARESLTAAPGDHCALSW